MSGENKIRKTMQELTPKILRAEAAKFAVIESTYNEPSLFGVTDGKKIGTYVEHKFRLYLAKNYEFEAAIQHLVSTSLA